MKNIESLNNEPELLIINYLTGSITENELSRLAKWINEDPQNRQQFNSLRNAWLLAGHRQENSPGLSEDLLFNFIYNKDKDKTKDTSFIQVDIRSKRLRFLKLAASWILFLGLGSVLTLWFSNKFTGNSTSKPVKKFEFHSPLGARSWVIMPDSTQIWLNAGTTIRYDQDYGTVLRKINLEGEAFFDVKNDRRHEFIVHTKEIEIQALGTRFNVKAYPEERTITATLEEGKINIRVPGSDIKKDNILLKPKDKFIYHKESLSSTDDVKSPADERILDEVTGNIKPGNIDVISNVRTELYTSWKDQRWIIEREPLSTLVPMLERRYNLKFIFENQDIKEFKFTGTIENENIDQLLTAISFAAPIEYLITKDTVMLYLNTDANEEFKKVMSGRKSNN